MSFKGKNVKLGHEKKAENANEREGRERKKIGSKGLNKY
jgi:hypothetical protein